MDGAFGVVKLSCVGLNANVRLMLVLIRSVTLSEFRLAVHNSATLQFSICVKLEAVVLCSF